LGMRWLSSWMAVWLRSQLSHVPELTKQKKKTTR
jgi:hypothetical protein